jgi:hypothetical protein
LPGADLFTNGPVLQVQIEIPPDAVKSLHLDPRKFVHATLRENTLAYKDVALHLKGSVGSFRELDDKPALTLDFDKFDAGQKFHGLRRIHLNNSVEDPSFCNELIGGELFRAAGVPAPRVTHAIVELNGRRLGLYVVKEGFTEDFLACYYDKFSGELYEPGEGHDVNQKLKRNSVKAPAQDPAALETLAAAALENDLSKRSQLLEKSLDVNEFTAFMAMEIMVGHRDGYCLARNNYRVYHDVESGKIVFFPHGMDQLFGNPGVTWQPQMTGLVAKSLMETPDGKARYRATFGTLFTNIFKVSQLKSTVDAVVARLKPALTASEFAAVSSEAAHLKERIVLRDLSLKHQLREPDRAPLSFTSGVAHLEGWKKVDALDPNSLEQTAAPDKTPALRISAAARSGASWRATALLGPGRYRFEGQVKVTGVKPLPYGKFQGAGLRVTGSVRQSPNVIGDSAWQPLSEPFEVKDETKEIEFVCELRATSGDAWFALDSLKVIQIQ